MELREVRRRRHRKFFTNEVGSIEKEAIPPTNPVFKNIRKECVDAETKARVHSYMDGRVRVLHVDSLVDSNFADGTRMVVANDAVVYITRKGLPSVETDLEINEMCDGHAKGKQVALAKGGLRVRSRLCLTDGSAMLIKYDTRVTASVNGSVKLVRRDRCVIYADDFGKVQVLPSSAWNQEAATEFADECKDCYEPPKDLAQNSSVGQLERSVSIAGVTPQPSTATAGDKKREVVVSRSPEKTSTTSANSNDVPPPPPPAGKNDTQRDMGPTETTYTFNIRRESVRIEDYEYNRFEVTLGNVLNPIVDLAGEVEGLKPVAITEKPLDPRLFIVSRSGDAVEVVSGDVYSAWRKLSLDSEDVTLSRSIVAEALTSMSADDGYQHQRMLEGKADAVVPFPGPSGSLLGPGASTTTAGGASASPPPSKLGAGVGCLSAQLHASCFQRRVRLNEGNDIYHFSEVFGSRLWQQKDLPAVASLDKHMEEAREAQRELQIRQAQAAREQGNNKNDDTNEEGENTSSQLMPVVYESLHLFKKSGAGSQAYSRVKEEYTKWKNFCLRERAVLTDLM